MLFRSLLLHGLLLGSLSVGNELGLEFSLLVSEWVDSLHLGSVGEWILLLVVIDLGVSDLSELGLDLIRVDDSGKIGASHHSSSEVVSRLLDSSMSEASEDVVKLLEGILGEDKESSEMSTWGELEDVESADVASVNTWEIPGGSLDIL